MHNIPSVTLPIESTQLLKYMHVRIQESGRSIVWAIECPGGHVKHDHVLEALEEATGLASKDYANLGGGLIAVNQHEKTILIYDRSLRHGSDKSRDWTAHLVQERFPGYRVETG